MALPDYWNRESVHRKVEDLATIVYRGIAIGDEFFVDPVNGADTNDGKTVATAFSTVEAGYDACTAEHHDVVYFIAGDTADSVAATLTWEKDYTHLIGVGSTSAPGIGQRSRMTSTVAAPALTISARGCLFKNIQVQNSYAGASGGVLVSGIYNQFENVYFNGINHATAGADASSYCLSVTGAENYFKRCTIGSVQTIRAEANASLSISTGAQFFDECLIQNYSETAGAFLVTLVAGTAGMSLLRFKECVFYNQTVNWATGITDVFNVAQTGSHYVLLQDCVCIGGANTPTWADTATHVFTNSPAAANTGGKVTAETS